MTATHLNTLLISSGHEFNTWMPHRLLERNGFIYKRTKGSHLVYFNASTQKTKIVPAHENRDIKKELSLLF